MSLTEAVVAGTLALRRIRFEGALGERRNEERSEKPVTENKVIIEAFSELAPGYEDVVDKELRRFWGWSYQGFVGQLLELVPVNAGDTILDVATGTAVIPRQLVDKVDAPAQVVGLDITLSMLKFGKTYVQAGGDALPIDLTCASAMAMPFPAEVFDGVVCGLATHHMDGSQMIAEMRRVLKTGGYLAIADVAASPYWQLPGVRSLLKVATFFYFLSAESITRAWAEKDAVSHVHTAEEWRALLAASGFNKVEVTELTSRHRWSPAPLVLAARKT